MSAYTYDRTASNSATPALDAAAKTDLLPKIDRLMERASKSADKAEGLVEKLNKQGSPTVKALVGEAIKTEARSAAQAAYGLLDLLRPVLQHGASEMRDAPTGTEVVKQAKQLIDGLQDLDKQHYGPLVGRSDRTPTETAEALHKLYMQIVFIRQTYRQFQQAYTEHQ